MLQARALGTRPPKGSLSAHLQSLADKHENEAHMGKHETLTEDSEEDATNNFIEAAHEHGIVVQNASDNTHAITKEDVAAAQKETAMNNDGLIPKGSEAAIKQVYHNQPLFSVAWKWI